MTTKSLCVLGLGLLAPAAWAADICEPLREQIEVQIAATGTTGFAVIVVDADAEVAGKVVGTCAMGARKLVYVRAGGTPMGAKMVRPVAAPPVARGKDADMITECRDGTVVRGNANCKP
ncbi:DUF1161 domain-containing protein [Hydrogenophaga sp. A37]|uniref:DUF1161 domain-containing protein n=1 Tax=Hydrogenophaga sp. A37 TaxID=1945864 RepID=UPI0009851BD8|nr:DUF1161 domain-containing protein [Hydrogenophaga sp. A37]OOG80552.1 hypothetical protein B0E41_20350 [Hydrogenophaga sp. A37]